MKNLSRTAFSALIAAFATILVTSAGPAFAQVIATLGGRVTAETSALPTYVALVCGVIAVVCGLVFGVKLMMGKPDIKWAGSMVAGLIFGGVAMMFRTMFQG